MESQSANESGHAVVSDIAADAEVKDQAQSLDAIDAALAEASQGQDSDLSDSSDYSDTSSREDEEIDDEDNENDEESAFLDDTEAPHTKHEIIEVEIPKLPENFKITDEMAIKSAGKVFNVASSSLVIQSNQSGEEQILDEGAVFCLSDHTVVGPLYETFGPIERPFYIIKFSPGSDVSVYHKDMDIFYVETASKFISTQGFKVKGSDASNLHDEEVAPEEQDFSDDEEEAASRAPKRRKRAKTPANKAPNKLNYSTAQGLQSETVLQNMQSLGVQRSQLEMQMRMQMQMQMQRQMEEWQQRYQQYAMYQQNVGQAPLQIPPGYQTPPMPQAFVPVSAPATQMQAGMAFAPASLQAPVQTNVAAPKHEYNRDRDDDQTNVKHQWPSAPPNY